MADNPLIPDPNEPPGLLDSAAQLSERWSRLEPAEQTLVVLALIEVQAGTFTSWAAWDRFAEAAMELLPALAAGTISADELREIALGQAFDDHDR